MLIYYRLSGFIAVVAMILNLLYMIAILAAFEASLTLPGIAGLVLTIGMAVDANIIIYERIREELRLGKSVRTAVDTGFARAFWTVFDAHVTNFVAGVVLYSYGSGPIRGFAVTLLVGIVTNLFTSYWLSHWMFDGVGGAAGRRARHPVDLRTTMPSTNPQQKFFEIIKPGSNYEFIGRQKYWIGLSIVLVSLTVLMLPLNAYVFKSRGHMLNWGVDFRGGSEIVLEFSRPVEAGEIRKTLSDAGFPDADVVKYADPTGQHP